MSKRTNPVPDAGLKRLTSRAITLMDWILAPAVIAGLLGAYLQLEQWIISANGWWAFIFISIPVGAVSYSYAHYLEEIRGLVASACQSAQRVERNRHRLEGIIRASMEAIITIDESQRIVLFNPRAEGLFGYRAEDVLGAPIEQLIPQRFREAHRKLVQRFGVTPSSERRMAGQREVFALHADGHEFPIEASISHSEEDGKKLYTIMLRDITERLKAAKALSRSQEELRYLADSILVVREEEQRRIADGLNQSLGRRLKTLHEDCAALSAQLRWAGHVQCKDGLAGIQANIDAAEISLRRICMDLRPQVLDELGLVPAVHWMVTDFEARYQIPVTLDVEPIDFDGRTANALFLIIQEALTNVVRHAHATAVRIRLRKTGATCEVSIVDNGVHSPSLALPCARSGLGLIGIRERARLLGGAAQTEQEDGTGFRVRVVFPLHKRMAHALDSLCSESGENPRHSIDELDA
ncbi:MAG: PAS domain S-box protein [Burkholderiaceae bacterium]|nr:PAS domain S-box protein [Burkholderiaceae bacterium]